MHILAYITDFFFQAKVSETGRQARVSIQIVWNPAEFEKQLQKKPALVIVDLAARDADPGNLIKQVKDRLPDTEVVAFGAHVDTELLQNASRAGARALSRSKFSRELPELFASVCSD
jgi:DNA-binding NarL/FixJ family response regulator